MHHIVSRIQRGLGGPGCRAEAAAPTHLCDGSLDGHGVDPRHGWVATVLQTGCWREVKKVESVTGGSAGFQCRKGTLQCRKGTLQPGGLILTGLRSSLHPTKQWIHPSLNLKLLRAQTLLAREWKGCSGLELWWQEGFMSVRFTGGFQRGLMGSGNFIPRA